MKFLKGFKSPIILVVVLGLLTLFLLVKFWQQEAVVFLSQITTSSTAQVELQNERVVVSFNISEADLGKADSLSNHLGVGKEWMQGVSIKLDAASTDSIKPFLPLRVALKFTDQGVDFESDRLEYLRDYLAQITKRNNVEQISPLGESFKWTKTGDFYNIEIQNPAEVLHQATATGVLKPSVELSSSPLWQVAEKLANNKLKVQNKAASGQIIFK